MRKQLKIAKLHYFILIFIAVILLSSCGGSSGSGDDNQTDNNLEKITFDFFDVNSNIIKNAEFEEISFNNISLEVFKNQLIIYCSAQITNSQINELKSKLKELNCSVVGQIIDFRLFQIEISPTHSYQEIADALKELEGISMVFPNMACSPDIQSIPVAGETGIWDYGFYWVDRINLNEAWNTISKLELSMGYASIGFVDYGYTIMPQYADDELHYISRDNDVTVYDLEGNYLSDWPTNPNAKHGAKVSNIAAGNGGDIEVTDDSVGVSWKSPIIISDVSHGLNNTKNSYFHVAAGIQVVIDKCPECKVINISLGVSDLIENDDGSYITIGNEKYIERRQFFRQAMHPIVDQEENDILLVFSAGNLRVDNDDTYFYFQDDDFPEKPDNWRSKVIIVGGSNEQDEVYDTGANIGSTMGSVVDIVAPAQDVALVYENEDDDVNGTSFAAPMVSGAAALIWTIRNDLDPSEVKDILIATSKKSLINDWTGTNIEGNSIGLLDVDSALKKAVFYNKTIYIEIPAQIESGDEYIVQWNDMEYATSYCIKESENTDFLTASTFCGDNTSQTYIHQVESDKIYYYKVIALNDDLGIQIESSVISVTVKIEGSGNGVTTYPDTVIDTISVGHFPWGIAITPNQDFIYVANEYSDTVTVIQTSDNTVVDTVSVGTRPHGISVAPNGNYAYVTNRDDDTVSVIQTSDNTVIDTISVGNFPYGVTLTPDGNFAYVSNYLDYTVSVIQTSNNTVIDTIAVGVFPGDITVSPNGSYAYVANQSNYVGEDTFTISVIQTSNNTVIDTISLGALPPKDVEITPDGDYVYVSNYNDDKLSVIQTSDNTVIETLSIGDGPGGIAITPDGSYLYVSNWYDNNVSIIQTSDHTIIDTISIGGDIYNPNQMIISPDGKYAYVVIQNADKVSVIGVSN